MSQSSIQRSTRRCLRRRPRTPFRGACATTSGSDATASTGVALGGLDALVFTAGVGEGSAHVRAEVCSRLGFLGVELDDATNAAAVQDADIATPASAVRVAVVRAREDFVAARAARALLGLGAQAAVEPLPLRRPGGTSEGSAPVSGRVQE